LQRNEKHKNKTKTNLKVAYGMESKKKETIRYNKQKIAG